jgi:hypothetical protein
VPHQAYAGSQLRMARSWQLDQRGSRLCSPEDVEDILTAALPRIEPLERLSICDRTLPIEIADRLWELHCAINGVTDNKAKLVACSKILHHALPDLIVPIDRTYTGRFLGFSEQQFQPAAPQRRIFYEAFAGFRQIALTPRFSSQVTGNDWRTSVGKLVDNLVCAFVLLEDGNHAHS